MLTVNAGTALTIAVATVDASDEPRQPITLDWRLRCATTDQYLTDWAAIDEPTATDEIVISGALNTLVDDDNPYEDRHLLVRTDEGLDTQAYDRIAYRVRNLEGD